MRQMMAATSLCQVTHLRASGLGVWISGWWHLPDVLVLVPNQLQSKQPTDDLLVWQVQMRMTISQRGMWRSDAS
jgi:hypothetical protein